MKLLTFTVLTALALASYQTQAKGTLAPRGECGTELRQNNYEECREAANEGNWDTSNCDLILRECETMNVNSAVKQVPNNEATSESNPYLLCETELQSKKALQILKGKIYFADYLDQPLEVLANSNIPTKKEKKAIALWATEHKKCRQLGSEWMSEKFPSAIVVLLDKADTDLLFSAADLYAGKISYGSFAKASVKRTQELAANVVVVVQQINQQQALEQQQRQQQAKDEQLRQQQQASEEQYRRQVKEYQTQQLALQRQQADAARKAAAMDAVMGYVNTLNAQTDALNARAAAQAQQNRPINCYSQQQGYGVSTTCR